MATRKTIKRPKRRSSFIGTSDSTGRLKGTKKRQSARRATGRKK